MFFEARAPEERRCEVFPKAFAIDCTPYRQFDFEETTRDFCAKENDQFSFNLNVCKIIVLGDVCVGKTCIINRFCCKFFDNSYKSTIGVDFQVERFDILGVPYNLQIWDTAGQERFKCIAQSYYRGAHVIVLVFDFTTIQTLFNCKTWLNEALRASPGPYYPFIFLIGTKKDLLSHQAYLNCEEIAKETASKELNAEYWAASSKTGENIDDLFKRIAALAFDKTISILHLKINEEGGEEKKITSSELISFRRNSTKSKRKIACEGGQCFSKSIL